MRSNPRVNMPKPEYSEHAQRSALQLYLLLFSFIMLLSACKKDIDSPVVRSFGSSDLTEAELKLSTEYASEENQKTARTLYIEDWERMAALYNLASQDKWEPDLKTQVLVKKAERQIIVNRFLEHKLNIAQQSGTFEVDSSEVKAYFNEFKNEFVFRETYFKLLRLYASEKDSATKLMRQLFRRNGVEKAIASAPVTSPRLLALNQASLKRSEEFIRNSQLHLENASLRTLLKQMRIGTTSPVVKINDSLYSVMYLIDLKPEGNAMELADAYDEIKERLVLEKQSAFLKQIERKARESDK
jgi:hypothetical protein